MKVLIIIGIAVFGAIGLFTGGCALVFLIGTDGTGGGYLDVQLMGLGIAAVCGLIIFGLVKAYQRQSPPEDDS